MTSTLDSLVSVIITTYGDPSCLARAINSVLNQTYRPIELIVVDDNGVSSPYAEQTLKIIASLNTNNQINFYRHEKNMNGAAARNTGIKHSTGKYITFLDNDDYMLPSRVQHAVDFLRNNNECDAVFCGVGIYEKRQYVGLVFPSFSDNALIELMLDERSMGTGSNLFLTRASVLSLNGFDTNFIRNQDVEFMVRFFRNYKSGSINEVDLIKGTSGTSNMPSYRKLQLVKERFNRTFLAEIDGMDFNDRNNYFRNLHVEFCRTALLSGNKTDIHSAFSDAANNGVKLSRFKYFYWALKGRYPHLSSILFWPFVFIRSRRIKRRLMKNIEFRVLINFF